MFMPLDSASSTAARAAGSPAIYDVPRGSAPNTMGCLAAGSSSPSDIGRP
jgi:hypothetical protein